MSGAGVLQSLARFEVEHRRQDQLEIEEMRSAEQGGRRAGGVAGGEERGLDGPEGRAAGRRWRALRRRDDLLPRVPGEHQIRGVVQPVDVDALVEADPVPAIPAGTRSIRVNGTTTSSREAPSCSTTRSPSQANADRAGASRAGQSSGSPMAGRAIASGNCSCAWDCNTASG